MKRNAGDTDPVVARMQRDAHIRLGPEGRIQAALEMSEAVRSIHLDGIRRRNPSWDERRVVRHYILIVHGVNIPEPE